MSMNLHKSSGKCSTHDASERVCLAYRAPESKEDDLSETDLNVRFYDHLARLPDDQQVVVVENRNPPQFIIDLPQTQMFSSSVAIGRLPASNVRSSWSRPSFASLRTGMTEEGVTSGAAARQ
jgi:hypothetical protein